MRRGTVRLARGDTVGVVATGFAVRPAPLQAGVERLRRWGYTVRLGEHVLAREGYLAGHDEQRLADLRRMIDDPEIKAIWFARGGYGTARLLEGIPWGRLARHPKLLIGYSDLTALFAAAVARSGVVCLYGPVVAELATATAHDRRSLGRMLRGEPGSLSFAARQVVVPGRCRGQLVGGNLTVLAHLLGTPFSPDWTDRVLLLEDVGEQAYALDRTLTQLRSAGRFRRLAGVLIGSLEATPRRRFPPAREVRDLVHENFAGLGIPVVQGLPIGHAARKATVPLGGVATIDTARRRVQFEP